jgi:hypothetical protein
LINNFFFVLIRSETYSDFHELVRNSSYYSRLPHLTIECVELDGIPDTLPIIIEEIYSPIEQLSTTNLIKSNKENAVLQTVQDFSKNPISRYLFLIIV